ncbi:GcrY protein, partial [Dietzia maris]|nr:GcrY protein [Dietzia maris]
AVATLAGTLQFQLVKSKEARREAGEHYTSETNILKTIGPLFLDDLQAEANRLCDNKSTSVKALREFRDSLATHVFVDPACGCGNFLVVAYRDLRRIETQIIREIRTREGQTGMALDATLETKVTIGQFHGIEINWWPAKIAETAMFLVDHQANRELAAAVGQAPERLPIAITAHIHHTNALQIDWKDLLPVPAGNTYVFGNPPFRGDGREQDQLRDLQAAWGEDKQLSRMDFVTGWHAKTLQLYASRAHGEWAFVTTNSISQGDQVPRLFEPIFDAGWRIKFAHRTFAWDSEAPGKAAVHCVIVGFTRDRSAKPELWDYPDVRGRPTPRSVSTGINAYLVDGPNVLVTKAAAPISPEVGRTVYGSKPTDDGNLIVEVDEYDEVMADPIAAKYVHQFVGARELLRGEDRWCLWLDGMNPADASRSQILKTRIERVRDFRSASRAASTRDFAQFPHLFRQRAKQDLPYVCIPRHVSENRRYFPVAKFGLECSR